eukprot:CAMPEP_0174369764 /NCGR_PEP_ID=MMETSP0811_2-20130205/93646_1 /TAXON_ID=73025 ORGANISM="Eutreptiella gymnastica-like, Strain CCMP1594" /NCGR_SAMPLE_ID=MMETSP0811_2 /ASSEMBLY_ACC=CAM_ASM_000667 /LENGTH=85 /DNA_ID=CAMNT_0015514541 /DNA_START=627 /DNA_END=880 /DNA_ORIENTATION=-
MAGQYFLALTERALACHASVVSQEGHSIGFVDRKSALVKVMKVSRPHTPKFRGLFGMDCYKLCLDGWECAPGGFTPAHQSAVVES